MLIDIHILQNHAPSSMNLDDTGSPKEATFGGYKRARISSQCIKRSIRLSEIFRAEMKGCLASRTRAMPELVRQRLLSEGIGDDLAEIAASKASGFGSKEEKKRKPEDSGVYNTAQLMFLTEADINAVAEAMKITAETAGSADGFEKAKIADIQRLAGSADFAPVTPDIAMFGRMTTSVAFRDCEAAVSVAHAISTHRVSNEIDFFTAIDDLKREHSGQGGSGASMIGDVEFNSACYYKYMSVDLDGLVANLLGRNNKSVQASEQERVSARQIASTAVSALIKSSVLTAPSGKHSSFAAHQLPAAVLVEIRPVKIPISYANAFVKPAWAGQTDLVTDSLRKLAEHVSALTVAFNLQASHRFFFSPEHGETEIAGVAVERIHDLQSLCDRLSEVIADG